MLAISDVCGVDARRGFNYNKVVSRLRKGSSSSRITTGSSSLKQVSASVSCASDSFASSYDGYVNAYAKAGMQLAGVPSPLRAW